MTDVQTEAFNAVYNAVTAKYTGADFATNYVNQPSVFPHIQLWVESNTTPRTGLNLNNDECFSNVVVHIEIFDNITDGKNQGNVDDIVKLIDPAMRLLGYRRTYCSPVPNYNDASVYRAVVRYSKIQPN